MIFHLKSQLYIWGNWFRNYERKCCQNQWNFVTINVKLTVGYFNDDLSPVKSNSKRWRRVSLQELKASFSLASFPWRVFVGIPCLILGLKSITIKDLGANVLGRSERVREYLKLNFFYLEQRRKSWGISSKYKTTRSEKRQWVSQKVDKSPGTIWEELPFCTALICNKVTSPVVHHSCRCKALEGVCWVLRLFTIYMGKRRFWQMVNKIQDSWSISFFGIVFTFVPFARISSFNQNMAAKVWNTGIKDGF